MWDVKLRRKEILLYSLYSFTLTMWDVKYFYGEDWALDGAGFTLTMWDVKNFNFMGYVQGNIVLP